MPLLGGASRRRTLLRLDGAYNPGMVKLQGRARILAGVAALGLVVAGGWLSTGAPNLTALNDGIAVSYPWRRGFGSLICAGGLVLLTMAVRKIWLSVIGLLLAGVAAGGALYQWTYRVEATGETISARRFLIGRSIAWREILTVGTEPGVVVLSGVNQRQIAIDTTDFSPTQRLVLSRTIARRVGEAAGGMAATLSPGRPPSP